MAIRIHKVYTKTGDKGATSLVGGSRVFKDAQRIEAYGCVDELNALVGLTRAFNHTHSTTEAKQIEKSLNRPPPRRPDRR